MSVLTLILIILLVVAVFGTGPWFGYSRGWGYGPMGGLVGILLLIMLVLFLTGNLGGAHVTTH